jgi:hypothetical protein
MTSYRGGTVPRELRGHLHIHVKQRQCTVIVHIEVPGTSFNQGSVTTCLLSVGGPDFAPALPCHAFRR